jgi:hypothetical protein
MAFVPELPGVAPTSYGQGFGNWQRYAGFNSQNQFGSMQPKPEKPAAAAVPPANVPVVDAVPTAPDIPMGQFGSQPQGSFGSNSAGQYGSLEEAVKAEEHNY